MTTTDQLTGGRKVFLELRELLFSDRTAEEMLAGWAPDEALLGDAVAGMLSGRLTDARQRLEEVRAHERYAEDVNYRAALAQARLLDGDPEGARDALRRLLGRKDRETRWELQVWALLREFGDPLDEGDADRVLGVVVDLGMEGGVATVAGFADGDARIFWSSGGGMLGDLKIYPQVSQAAKRLVDSAQAIVSALPFDGSHALPGAGRVRLALLTPAGIRAVDEREGDVQQDDHRLFPVYLAMHGLIASLRHVYEGAKK